MYPPLVLLEMKLNDKKFCEIIFHFQDMSSINDGYRSQSRIFSKMEKESLITANQMDSVRYFYQLFDYDVINGILLSDR